MPALQHRCPATTTVEATRQANPSFFGPWKERPGGCTHPQASAILSGLCRRPPHPEHKTLPSPRATCVDTPCTKTTASSAVPTAATPGTAPTRDGRGLPKGVAGQGLAIVGELGSIRWQTGAYLPEPGGRAYGEVSELADEHDLGSCAARHGSSSLPFPTSRTLMNGSWQKGRTLAQSS